MKLRIEGKRLLLDGEEITVYSGAIHYFRTVPEYWRDRLLKLKLAGFNTVETYICWNLHEPRKGSFDFSGGLDFGRFLDIARELGLYAIVRPSPYICAEVDLGGLPSWLLAEPWARLRCSDGRFLGHVRDYYAALLPRLAPHQTDRGGNVILVQVENEYGSYGNDAEYLRSLVRMLREGGITVPLFTSDGADAGSLGSGTLPDIMPAVNFGSGTEAALDALDRFSPDTPPFCAEFWCGWFDHWGEKRAVRPTREVEEEVAELLRLGANFNIYMFHGGTSFGYTAGANYDDRYRPTVTSYDYNALLTEWGDYTPRYHAVRRMLHRHLKKKPLPLPPSMPLGSIGSVRLTEEAELIAQAYSVGEVRHTAAPPTFEEMGQASGFALYRTETGGICEPCELTLDGLCDRAHVFLNGNPLGILYRGDGVCSLELPESSGGVLEILVEAMGRVNYGAHLTDCKGIVGGVRLGGRYLFGWETVSLPMDNTDGFRFSERSGGRAPIILRGYFDADPADMRDCFVGLGGFSKGVVWVNGFNLGRYWSVGPQRSLYLPAPLLRERNVIEVLELDGTSSDTVTLGGRE